MKVAFLFSHRPKSTASRIISWASSFEKLDLKEVPSHVAILLDDELVIESTFLSGVRFMPYSQWKSKNEEQYKLPYGRVARSVVLDHASKIWGSKYDALGILFFAWRFLGLILFNIPLPNKNQWESDDSYFCSEFVGFIVRKNYGMKTPAKICNDLLKDILCKS